MKAPLTLNGFKVVRSKVHTQCVTVMCDRGDSDYVVATWWPLLGNTWSWGHYLDSADEADFCFNDVAKRNAKR